MGERFRGSSDLPLTGNGIEQARTLAMKLAEKGGLDEIRASSMGRTIHTAKILSQYTHAPITDITDSLHPWHLGYLEGQPVTPEHLALQNHLISDNPDEALPGRGPQSIADGESFNTFKNRTLAYFKSAISRSAADPSRAIALVTHYRDKRLLDAWMRKGMDPEGAIDGPTMTTKDENDTPSSVIRLHVDPSAGPQLSGVDLDGPGKLQGGLYIIRHGETAWNSSEGS